MGGGGGRWWGGQGPGSGEYSLTNYSVAYEETQSNRVSDFRGFMCYLFLKAILLDFYLFIKNTKQTERKDPDRLGIKFYIFSKIKQAVLDDFVGLLDVLRMMALVISYLTQTRVYTEEQLSSDSHMTFATPT